MNTIGKILVSTLFLVGLVYVLLPGATRVEDFAPIPESTKSGLEGDTWQNKNIAGYFSQWERAAITTYYRQLYNKSLFGLPSIRVNHPPEDAKVFVRREQESTFLEEYIHPLRDSLYVNGYEPTIENAMFHKASGFVGNHIEYQGDYYLSKTTLRFHPSFWWARLFNYLAIWGGMIALIKLSTRAMKEPA